MATAIILGDGDFTFSLAFCRKLYKKPDLVKQKNDSTVNCLINEKKHKLTAYELKTLYQTGIFTGTPYSKIFTTSFDSHQYLKDTYPYTERVLLEIEAFPQTVVCHGVNACLFHKLQPLHSFDVVIWNHPHLGVENSQVHRWLICHFCFAASQALKLDGCLVISILEGQAARWELLGIAERFGFELCEETSHKAENWEGYQPKRNNSAKSFKNSASRKHYSFKDYYNKEESLSFNSTAYIFLLGNTTKGIVEKPVEACSKTTEDREDERKKFPCKECSASFRTEQGRFTHTRQVHELKKYGVEWYTRKKDIPTFKCSKCDRTFYCDNDRNQHETARHSFHQDHTYKLPSTFSKMIESQDDSAKTEYGFYSCSVCKAAVSNEITEDQHAEELTPLKALEKHVCEECGSKFYERRAFLQHANYCLSKKRMK